MYRIPRILEKKPLPVFSDTLFVSIRAKELVDGSAADDKVTGIRFAALEKQQTIERAQEALSQ